MFGSWRAGTNIGVGVAVGVGELSTVGMSGIAVAVAVGTEMGSEVVVAIFVGRFVALGAGVDEDSTIVSD